MPLQAELSPEGLEGVIWPFGPSALGFRRPVLVLAKGAFMFLAMECLVHFKDEPQSQFPVPVP